MSSLILHPTSTALWHSLLHDAQTLSCVQLHSDLECYLLFLLMRFSEQPTIANTVLGLEFLRGLQHPISDRCQQQQLKEVGDQCLLFAGLFPERAKRRRVRLSYFVKLGQSAYCTLAHFQDEALFARLADDFPLLIDVLQATRNHSPASYLLQSFELWHETKSPAAWKRLCNAAPSLALSLEITPQKKH